jgi:hypothetical protein
LNGSVFMAWAKREEGRFESRRRTGDGGAVTGRSMQNDQRGET